MSGPLEEHGLSGEKQYFGLTRVKKSVWEGAEYLNTLVDDSDPDTDLTQIEHLLQTSDAIRTGIPAGWCWLDSSTILGSAFACMVSRNGVSWTHSRLGAPGPTRSSFLSTSARILMRKFLRTKPSTASTGGIVAWKSSHVIRA